MRVLGLDWEGKFSCRYCGTICSVRQWAEPHTKKHCLMLLEEMIESGDLVRSPKGRLGDVQFIKQIEEELRENDRLLR